MASAPKWLSISEGGMRAAAAVLAGGGVVAFPTESFYGVAVRADSEAAVARLATLKSRTSKPIPLVAATLADVHRIGPVPALLEPLVHVYWPGPLTVAIPAAGDWPAPLAGDAGTIGIRIPGCEPARRLAAASGGLLTASSANLAGGLPPVRPEDLDPALGVDAVVDGGELAGGPPSTVVGVRDQRVVVFRAGAVSIADLEIALGRPVAAR